MASLTSPLMASRPMPLGLSSRKAGSAPAGRAMSVNRAQGAFRPSPAAPQRLAVRLNNSMDNAMLQTFDESDVKKTISTGGDVSVNYDFERWAKHESPWRYLRHMQKIFGSRVLLELKWVIAAVSATAAAICYAYSYGSGYLVQMGINLPTAPLAPHTLMASVIGLLLVFRTNSSYSRWYEARGLWGLAVNRLRDIQRQASTWWSREDPALCQARLEALQRWTTACIFSLKHHLRPGGSLENDLANVLPTYELQALMSCEHKPMYALQVCSELNRVSGACPELQTRMDRNFTIMEDVIGACEKILRTPIPVNYTRHTSRFLTVWMFTLPAALWPVCGWYTVPVCTIIAYLMFGIEHIGVFIEEPFTYLQLHAIASVIEKTTLEVLWCHGVDHEGMSAREIVEKAESVNVFGS